jgi:hypothetical protein
MAERPCSASAVKAPWEAYMRVVVVSIGLVKRAIDTARRGSTASDTRARVRSRLAMMTNIPVRNSSDTVAGRATWETALKIKN